MRIGIVDITTVGSTICQLRICEAGGPSGAHLPFSIDSKAFSEYLAAAKAGGWDAAGDLIAESLRTLPTSCGFYIVPSNTPHYGYVRFKDAVANPVLNIVEVVAEECLRKGYKRVAILGTSATMNGGLYAEPLERRGIELVVPNESTREAVDKFIFEEIVPVKVTDATRLSVLEQIKPIDCDAVILGCTELPDVYSEADIGKPVLDTTRLLADKAVELGSTTTPESFALTMLNIMGAEAAERAGTETNAFEVGAGK